MSQTLKNYFGSGSRVCEPRLIGQLLSNRLVNGNDALSVAWRQHNMAELKLEEFREQIASAWSLNLAQHLLRENLNPCSDIETKEKS